jgi:hypothetical protein
MSSPTHFEDELLTQLRQVVAQNPDPGSEAGRRRTPVLRRRLALSGGGLAVAGAVAVILISGSGSATPSAYAVAALRDGSVTVHVRSLSDASGLQSSLRAAGVPAIVNYAPAGKLPACPLPKGATLNRQAGSVSKEGTGKGPSLSSAGVPPDRLPSLSTNSAPRSGALPAPPAGASVTSSSIQVTNGGVTFTIDPGTIKPDQQVVITTSEGTLGSIGVAIVDRSVGACSATAPSAP